MAQSLSSEDLLVGGGASESSVFKTVFVFFIFHGLYLFIPLFFVVGPFLVLLTSYRLYALVCIVCYWTWVLTDGDYRKHGRPWPYVENLPFIRYILEWLPMRILRTQELDPSKKYVFACHPHGTVAFNRAVVGFATNSLWNKAFPKVDFRVLTARAAFFVPFIRELWLWTYCVDASREVATKVLRDLNCSVFVYPGGEKEQIQTEYQKHKVYLSSRKGFVRLALKEGANLVPVYAFGETDLYHHSQFALNARKYLVKKFGVAIPLMYGQCGLMPYRVPVTLVFGKPLHLTKTTTNDEEPSSEDIDTAHTAYCSALMELFDNYKGKMGCEGAKLEIL